MSGSELRLCKCGAWLKRIDEIHHACAGYTLGVAGSSSIPAAPTIDYLRGQIDVLKSENEKLWKLLNNQTKQGSEK